MPANEKKLAVERRRRAARHFGGKTTSFPSALHVAS
jgi:hypothetical protein